METEIKKTWNLGNACKKLITWDKRDWIWVFFTIVIIILSYLYWTETKVARAVYSNIPYTCQVYDDLKNKEIQNGTKLEDINISHLGELTIQNVTS